uniref:ARAD1D42086p n=1 Tax=Blastobotrys adeninivorans TaxID=409370 RepID=A0A060TIX8_BLAAD
MWLVSSDSDEVLGNRTLWIRPGNTLIAGRITDAQICFPTGERTVSRQHFKLSVASPTPGCSSNLSARSKLVISDLGTKFGTRVNGSSVPAGGELILSSRQGDRFEILLGKSTKRVIVEWKSFVISFSTGHPRNSEDHIAVEKELQSIFEPLDIRMSVEMGPLTTHYLNAGRRGSTKYLLALVQSIPIVSKDYAYALRDASSNMERDFYQALPNAEEYVPDNSPNLKADPSRTKCFRGKSFVFSNPTQFDGLMPVITAAGGKAYLSPSASKLVQFVKDNVLSGHALLVQVPTNQDAQQDRTAQTVDKLERIYRASKALGIPLIKDQDISQAILHCKFDFVTSPASPTNSLNTSMLNTSMRESTNTTPNTRPAIKPLGRRKPIIRLDEDAFFPVKKEPGIRPSQEPSSPSQDKDNSHSVSRSQTAPSQEESPSQTAPSQSQRLSRKRIQHFSSDLFAAPPQKIQKRDDKEKVDPQEEETTTETNETTQTRTTQRSGPTDDIDVPMDDMPELEPEKPREESPAQEEEPIDYNFDMAEMRELVKVEYSMPVSKQRTIIESVPQETDSRPNFKKFRRKGQANTNSTAPIPVRVGFVTAQPSERVEKEISSMFGSSNARPASSIEMEQPPSKRAKTTHKMEIDEDEDDGLFVGAPEEDFDMEQVRPISYVAWDDGTTNASSYVDGNDDDDDDPYNFQFSRDA